MKTTFAINLNFASLIDPKYADNVLFSAHSFAQKNNSLALVAYSCPAFKALSASIDRLDIGIRTYGVLRRAGIKNIYDLMTIPNDEWWNIRGFAPETAFDLKEALTKKQLLPVRPVLLRAVK